jgi:DNA-binding transcriptional LysR family regulator
VLDLRRIRVLRAVQRAGSVTDAARALSYTPSAISQQIAKLERETGLTLLRRVGRSVELTDAALRLLARTDAILDELAAIEAEIAAANANGAAFRLGAFETAANTIVPPALGYLRQGGARVRLEVLEGDPIFLLDQVRTGDLDAAIVFEYDGVPLSCPDPIELRPLSDEEICVLLPGSHPAANAHELRVADLAGEVWIREARGSACESFTEALCHSAGFEPTIGAEASDYALDQVLVEAGIGIALVPALGLVPLREGLIAKRLSAPRPSRRVFFASRRGSLNGAARAILVALREGVASAAQRVMRETPLRMTGFSDDAVQPNGERSLPRAHVASDS